MKSATIVASTLPHRHSLTRRLSTAGSAQQAQQVLLRHRRLSTAGCDAMCHAMHQGNKVTAWRVLVIFANAPIWIFEGVVQAMLRHSTQARNKGRDLGDLGVWHSEEALVSSERIGELTLASSGPPLTPNCVHG
eukprot:1160011-Pelagomonas_calceolata.AAC.1